MVTLCGGADRLGVGVDVSLEGGDELGHLLVTLDAAEGSFGVEHAGGGPAQHHLPVAPTGYVAVGGSGDGDHRLDGVAGSEGPGEASVEAQSGDGKHLLQPFTQRRGGAGIVLIQLCSKAFALRSPGARRGWLNALTSLASTHAFSLSGR